MVKWLPFLWGFSGFSGFLMVLMVWNLIPGSQSIRGAQAMISHQPDDCMGVEFCMLNSAKVQNTSDNTFFSPPIHVFFDIDTTVQMCYLGLPGNETLLLPCENQFLIVFTLIPKHTHARTHPFTRRRALLCRSLPTATISLLWWPIKQ